MEPNENIPRQPVRPVNPAGVGTPRPAARPVARPVAPRPVASAPVVEPVEPAETKEPTFDNGPSVVGKKERKTGWILAIILLLIIAAGGVGFGVWAWMDGNAQRDQLNSQISALQQQNAELQDELASSSNTTINIDTDGGTVDTADYIYVGEWGIKIKIPENLEKISYSVRSWDEEQYAGVSLCVSGAATGYGNGTPSFIMSNGMVCLSKNSRSADGDDAAWWEATPVGEYYVQGPQALMGDEADADWEQKSVGIIREMLENETNRSAI